MRLLIGDFRRRRDAEKLGREGDLIAGRRRLVVDHVEHAVGAPREAGVDRLRDVVDVDAVRDVAGLGDALRGAAQEPHHAVLARPIDAAEPQDRDRRAAPRAQLLPGRSASTRALPRRARPGITSAVSSIQAPPLSA